MAGGTSRDLVRHGVSGNNTFVCFLDSAVSGKVNFNIVNSVGTVGSSSLTAVTINAWNHIVCIYDNSLGSANVKIYVNGVVGGTTGNLTGSPNLSAIITLANSSTDFQGRMKDFRWYTTKALTQTEVNDIRADNPTAPTPDYWLKMEEGTGNPVDSISGTKTGILTNGPTWIVTSQSTSISKYNIRQLSGRLAIIYNVLTPADSTATLATGGTTRYGIELNGATGALVGKQISTFTVSLKKSLTPSGNVTATIRRASDDAAVATFQESPLATSLSTSFVPVVFTLTSPYTLQNGDKIQVEYSGAANIMLEVYTTDQFDGALTRRVRLTTGTYATGNTNDIVATIYASLTSTSKYNIRQLASSTVMSLYDILHSALSQVVSKYDIRQLASCTIISIYDILEQLLVVVSSVIISKYNIRQLTSSSTTSKYNIRTLASSVIRMLYDILEILYPVESQVTSKYSIRQLASSVIKSMYDIIKKDYKPITVIRDNRFTSKQRIPGKYSFMRSWYDRNWGDNDV